MTRRQLRRRWYFQVSNYGRSEYTSFYLRDVLNGPTRPLTILLFLRYSLFLYLSRFDASPWMVLSDSFVVREPINVLDRN